MTDLFEKCHEINSLIHENKEEQARNKVILLLDIMSKESIERTPIVNKLVRDVGLYPYIEEDTADWQERYVCKAFSEEIGGGEVRVLHREQSRLLGELLSGADIAVSAPTSFGKSFVIDSFISIKQPKTVVIIVPTIALMDETRRRISSKFSRKYKIITSSEQSLGDANILIFPQERASSYFDKLKFINLLVIDEFYKASKDFDKERSPALIRAILKFSEIAAQRYFLAPNIDELIDDVITEGMSFLKLDFNTVFLNKRNFVSQIGRDESKKSAVLLNVLEKYSGKTLVYAGTYSNITKLSNLFIDHYPDKNRPLLDQFHNWLSVNYSHNWSLAHLSKKGIGVHNGRLHRSLSQIQIRLFEEENGLDCMISTSSIIEGVNTSAQNVVLWSNKNGQAKINDFTYKNIIGRGGRMFRHFVGDIFILENPPLRTETQLTLDIPDEVLGVLEGDTERLNLTAEQTAKIIAYKQELMDLIGEENHNYIINNERFSSSDTDAILGMARDVSGDPASWNGVTMLNSPTLDSCDRILYKLIRLKPGGWGLEYRKVVAFIKIITGNWNKTIPELLDKLDEYDIDLDAFFQLERLVSYEMSSLIADIEILYNRMSGTDEIDLSPAITNFSNSFLPPLICHLEEYGLPRMISRKLQRSGSFDFERQDLDIHDILQELSDMGVERLTAHCDEIDSFDRYILDYFYEGIGQG
jgi:hypothetical protein